ncbi:MAG: O-antigen polymerase [Solirubrobacteraceae bacterium]
MSRRGAAAARQLALGASSLLVVVTCGYLTANLSDRAITVAPRWILLGVLAGLALAAVIWAARHDQLLAPLGVASLTMLVFYVARPLQLFLSSDELLHSGYNTFATPLQVILNLRAQEITLFVDTRLSGSLDDAFTRAMLGLTAFFVLFLVGYHSSYGRVLAGRAARIGQRLGDLDLRLIIGLWLVIGLAGEVIVLGRAGGLGGAAANLGSQGNLAVDFSILVILNFYTVGLLMWLCWHPPTTPVGRIGLALAITQLVGFYALLGSRTLVLVPILLTVVARNELHRPWRLGVLTLASVLAVLFSAGYLGTRESSRQTSFAQLLPNIPKYALDVRAILNSEPVFDDYLEETNYIPGHAPYRYGGEFGQGLLGEVPRVLYPDKPESNDLTFRELLWANRFSAGRPVGAAGEFYRDFGIPGILVGALLLGILARGLAGLRAREGGPGGRSLRAAMFVAGVVLLYEFLVGSYSLVLGSALEVVIPLLLAVRVFGRPR